VVEAVDAGQRVGTVLGMRLMTEDEINAEMTVNGGFTRETLQSWGIAWPPPKGWKQTLMREETDG